MAESPPQAGSPPGAAVMTTPPERPRPHVPLAPPAPRDTGTEQRAVPGTGRAGQAGAVAALALLNPAAPQRSVRSPRLQPEGSTAGSLPHGHQTVPVPRRSRRRSRFPPHTSGHQRCQRFPLCSEQSPRHNAPEPAPASLCLCKEDVTVGCSPSHAKTSDFPLQIQKGILTRTESP